MRTNREMRYGLSADYNPMVHVHEDDILLQGECRDRQTKHKEVRRRKAQEDKSV